MINGGTNVAGPTLDSTTAGNGPVQQGLRGLDTDGTEIDVTTGHYYDLSGVATQVRLAAATIDASGSAADVILRVSTNAASPVGAQDISTGTGNDHVIFDNLNDTRAGLTISDTVNAGDGDDTLVIDGTGVRISWVHLNGPMSVNFENLQIVGTSAAALSTLLGQNAYNLTLTNDLIQANGSGMLNIINDNDANNDQSGVSTGTYWLNTAGTGVESGVTIDARSLNAQNHFTYNGEEGAIIDPTLPLGTGVGQLLNPANISATTADRFIFSDANINGGNVIDGGALDNLSDTNSIANNDIMEVRNTATVTAGDMQGLSNIGIIAGVNDQAVAQTLDLELTDSVIDALVDSYHAATAAQIETVNVRLNNAGDIATPVAGMGLTLDASTITSKVAVNVLLDQVAGLGATDSIQLSPSGGVVTLDTFVTAGNAAAFVGPADTLVLSLSKFNWMLTILGSSLVLTPTLTVRTSCSVVLVQ
ncbi:MAG: hypothetical protein H6940_08995 [Burkholderiales bacterium]|nr:hypothetical protein [Burkholderiales bacterium]